MNNFLIDFYCSKKFQFNSFLVYETDYFPNEIPKNRSLQCTVRVCLETIYAKTALYLLCYLLPNHSEPEMKNN